ncbi:methyltransferase domain-containing protein [Dongia deserti]|uniref:methyltransferase domain-containing protein n=1 Tax=Dongia deserti TaxID=2268030 RepID=UPI000E6536AE|nr:methyltransferase domain-containing protein [Dongia deserti]
MRFKKLYRRHLRYPLWRLRHPFTPYETYYAWVVTRKLKDGRGHPAIGPTARAARGQREMIDVLLRHGLQPHHTFVDYGCGSLRLGKPLVEFLECGRFWGLDLAQEFLDEGIRYIGSDLNHLKQPTLRVIDDAGLAAAKSARPDFIGAWHVCGKIPDHILDGFFRKVLGLMHVGTQVFLQFEDSGKREQLHGLAWSLPEETMIAAVKGIDPKLTVDIFQLSKRRHRNMRYLCAHIRY